MAKTAAIASTMLGAAALGSASQAFTVAAPGSVSAQVATEQRSLRGSAPAPASGSSSTGAVAMAAVGLAAVAASRRSRRSSLAGATVVPVEEQCYRDQLVARRAELKEAGAPSVEETDAHVEALEQFAKQMVAGASAGVVFTSQMGQAVAYPIFAQQNYKEPREYSGKIVCANCHLASKPLETKMPDIILPDTIFKVELEVPCKYEKRVQPIADGSKAPLNVGAIAVMPEGFQLAPKNRLPKSLKKEMKGLSWSAYSKEKPNIVVAGPVPGQTYPNLVLPILAPDPAKLKDKDYGKFFLYFGANRGRGQVYPEGNNSNNIQYMSTAAGKISAIDGLKITIDTANGPVVQELGAGADIVVVVGEQVAKDEPLTTNPNVGGFGQEEKEIVIQDMQREYAYCAFAFSVFLSQVAFTLKKKQFEKVQLAEGF